ncbi:PREDICTED: disease resistance protein RGA2-like [Erythranthe guttata]|uniref:disease resistance protein RGA2-like n=1 Tax=Erythranthe guttata TaxID=4155 RepID=UPI00064DB16D|nr:PREDICTED: disease resistance protein RGA2-like [Erythranthe guttata]|eukprot:XP_012829381.1 PREDICTED: disease resistance protein RGA2-like [Erythranthe guttata]
MAGEVVLGAAVQVLLQNLISVSVEQISLVTDFDKHLKRLNDCVSTIHSFLNDAEKKQVTDETVKRWLRKLEGVAFDADNLLDELNYQHLSKKLHTDEYKMRKKVQIEELEKYGVQTTFRACHALKKLPNTLEHLMSLRHLHVPQIELPLGIGRLTSLRTLQYFGVSNENGCGIDELGSLKNLQGELQIYNLEKVCGK